jgi:hypothetical protein
MTASGHTRIHPSEPSVSVQGLKKNYGSSQAVKVVDGDG